LVEADSTPCLIAEAIGNDEDPGLSGEALDAWNTATARAINIARNWE
jgi:hypothetical protein